MSYLKKYLLPGESVLYTTRLHWIVLGWHLVFGTLLGLGGLYILIDGNSKQPSFPGTPQQATVGGLVLLFAGAALIGIGLIKRNATIMIVTNRRVLVKIGLASRRTWEMEFSKIESVAVEEPVVGRMLGYGTVVIRGVGGTPESFPRIADPLEFRRKMLQQIEAPETNK